MRKRRQQMSSFHSKRVQKGSSKTKKLYLIIIFFIVTSIFAGKTVLDCLSSSKANLSKHHRSDRISQVEHTHPILDLMKLLSTHPAREIREDLIRLLREHKVVIDIHDRWDNRAWACVFLDTTNYGLTPIFNVSPRLLYDPENTLGFKQLIILHEFQHVKQIFAQNYPLDHFGMNVPGSDWTREDYRLYYEAEVEAYLYECRFAVSHNMKKHRDFCKIYADEGELALRRMVARITVKNQPGFETNNLIDLSIN